MVLTFNCIYKECISAHYSYIEWIRHVFWNILNRDEYLDLSQFFGYNSTVLTRCPFRRCFTVVFILLLKKSNVSRVICVIVKYRIWCYIQILNFLKFKILRKQFHYNNTKYSTYLLHLVRNTMNHYIFNAKLFNTILQYFFNLSLREIFSSLFCCIYVCEFWITGYETIFTIIIR